MRKLVDKARRINQTLIFYLAADSQEAYHGIKMEFGPIVVFTPRTCASVQHCDARDCASLHFALIDMLNLGRTRLVLGSGHSSFSEVAAKMGASSGRFARGLPIRLAGKHFGNRRLLQNAADVAAVGPQVQSLSLQKVKQI